MPFLRLNASIRHQEFSYITSSSDVIAIYKVCEQIIRKYKSKLTKSKILKQLLIKKYLFFYRIFRILIEVNFVNTNICFVICCVSNQLYFVRCNILCLIRSHAFAVRNSDAQGPLSPITGPKHIWKMGPL